MLFVFDTNTLVSAVLRPDGIPAMAVLHATQKGRLIFSKETEMEYLDVITREKFNKYLPKNQRLNIATRLIQQSENKTVSIQLTGACKDADDVKFLNLAVECKATSIVSGDRHLKDLSPFRGIPIISPADFLKIF